MIARCEVDNGLDASDECEDECEQDEGVSGPASWEYRLGSVRDRAPSCRSRRRPAFVLLGMTHFSAVVALHSSSRTPDHVPEPI